MHAKAMHDLTYPNSVTVEVRYDEAMRGVHFQWEESQQGKGFRDD